MAFFACGTHIEQKPKRPSRFSQADVAEMQHAACSLLEVLSGNELTCNDDLLAITVELQLIFFIGPRTLYSMFALFIELPFA